MFEIDHLGFKDAFSGTKPDTVDMYSSKTSV